MQSKNLFRSFLQLNIDVIVLEEVKVVKLNVLGQFPSSNFFATSAQKFVTPPRPRLRRPCGIERLTSLLHRPRHHNIDRDTALSKF